MYQEIVIVGNLGADPVLAYTPTGNAVVHYPVAGNRSWTDAQGRLVTKTVWFRITRWGKAAENDARYLFKGRQVFVTGEVEKPRPYMGKDGTPQAGLDVTGRIVRYLGDGRQSNEPIVVVSDEEEYNDPQ